MGKMIEKAYVHNTDSRNLSAAEIDSLGQLAGMCANYRRKGKCRNDCSRCPWGDFQNAFANLDSFQRAVIRTSAARHYHSGIPSFGVVVDDIVGALMYLFTFGSFAASVWFVVWVVKKILHG